jgi:hypothetical protein
VVRTPWNLLLMAWAGNIGGRRYPAFAALRGLGNQHGVCWSQGDTSIAAPARASPRVTPPGLLGILILLRHIGFG